MEARHLIEFVQLYYGFLALVIPRMFSLCYMLFWSFNRYLVFDVYEVIF
jgi:hypothetical protein